MGNSYRFLNKDLFILFYVRMLRTYTMYMPAHRGQMRVSDVLELELWMFVSHHVGLGTEPGALNLQASSLVPVSV